MTLATYVGTMIGLLTVLLGVVTAWGTKGKEISRTAKAILVCIFTVIIVLIIVTTYVFIQNNVEHEGPTGATSPTNNETEYTEPEETIIEPFIPEPTLIPTDVRVGDTIIFGTYEQDNTTAKAEKIEWLVLAKDDDRILVLSQYGLDSECYNKTYKAVTWETSSIRSWLNEGFYKDAFTTEEQKLILLSRLNPGDSPDKSCDHGTATEDYLFLLSWEEVQTYIKENALIDTNNTLLCRPTIYAANEKGAYKNGNGYGWWWLRTSANRNFSAYSINSDSSTANNGTVNSINASIRPAMWLSIGE